MTQPLETLAQRLEQDPFFLACPLHLFAQSEGLEEKELAKKLGCSLESLVFLRLCRAPEGEAAKFQKDIECIASRFQIQGDVLAEVMRRGEALWNMKKKAAAKTLMAARDADQPKDPSGGGL